jgi:hypothetical protein
MNTRVGLVLMALLLAATAFAQGFWQKKAPGAWTLRECAMLLTDSPWAKSRTIGDVLIEDLEKAGSIEGREDRPWITYAARFWSATPMRQAFVRQRQLSKDFNILPPEQKRSVAERNDIILGMEFPDRIVLAVDYATNVDSYRRDLARYWQTRPASAWSMDTFLITGRGRIPPLDVRVVQGEGGQFALHFPRTVNEQPVVGPGDKNISLEFVHPNVGVLQTERMLFNFKVKEMTVAGATVY